MASSSPHPTRATSRTRARRPDAPTSAEELDERKAAVLKAVVCEYIAGAQPVGSSHITGTPGVEVSSATVRSEMAALEREGYLVQPHTSAGRIPTDKGYRYYVDHLGGPGELASAQRQEVRRFFRHLRGEVEELLGRSSVLLANLTDYASVVVGPSHGLATIRAVHLVALDARRVLLVVVLSDGAVEKRTIELTEDTSEDVVHKATLQLDARLLGRTLAEEIPLSPTGDAEVDSLILSTARAIGEMAQSVGGPENVFVGGSSRMAAAFDAVETVRSVLAILEEQLVVVDLVEAILDRGLSVAIGMEHGFEPLSACALVVAPLKVEGEMAGTVGVLGPTRMNYPRALAAVHLVGEELGDKLGRQRGDIGAG